MEQPRPQDLKYGVIYVYYDPMVKAAVFGSQSVADLVRKIAHPFEVEMMPEEGRGMDNTLMLARRFNVGNIGQCATVSLRLSDNNLHGVQFDALHKFCDLLFRIEDGDDGDITLDESDFGYCSLDFEWNMASEAQASMAAPQDKTRVESPAGRLWHKMAKRLKTFQTEEAIAETKPAIDVIQEEEKREVALLERERRDALQAIRQQIVTYIALYHQDPTELMEELLRGKVIVGHPGRLLVNGDLKVVLPEFDEMEVKMPAMCRTLYILFLKRRKQGGGIVLRDIDEYRDEIMDIYGMVKPGASDDRVEQTVNNLCDPMGDSLNQMISRINRCIKSVISDKEHAKQYTIRGNRGGAYAIALDPELIELPRAITA